MLAFNHLTNKDELHLSGTEQCSQCGKCSSGCPAARFLTFRPRKLTLMVQRDQVEEVVDSDVIWWCTQCHQCMERCPREVSPYNIIIYLQNLAIKRGLAFPKDLGIFVSGVKSHGVIQLPQEVIDKEFEDYDRENLGLPSFKGPKNIEAFNRALDKIMEGGS